MESDTPSNNTSTQQNAISDLNTHQTPRLIKTDDPKGETTIQSDAAGEDLIVSGTENLDISNEIYNNVYVYDSAKLILRNTEIQGNLQISGNAEVQVLENSVLLYATTVEENSILTIDNPQSLGYIYSYGNSTVTVTRAQSFGLTAWDHSLIQFSDISYLYNIEVHDDVTLSFSNITSSDYWYFYGPSVTISDIRPANSGGYGPSLYFYSNTTGSILNSEVRRLRLDYVDNSLVLYNVVIHEDLWISHSTVFLSGLSVGKNLYLQETSNVELVALQINGSIHPQYHYEEWDGFEERRSSLRLANMSASISSDPTNNDEYIRFGLDTLVVDAANATVIDLNVTAVELYTYAMLQTLATTILTPVVGDGSGTVSTITTIQIGSAYYIGGSDVITLTQGTFSQITVFGNARLYASNITITSVLQVLENALVEISGSYLDGTVSVEGYGILIVSQALSLNYIYVRDSANLNVTQSSSFGLQAHGNGVVQLIDITYLYHLEIYDDVYFLVHNVTSSDYWYFYGPNVDISQVNPTHAGNYGPSLYFYSNTSGYVSDSEVRRISLSYVDNSLHLNNLVINQALWVESATMDLVGLTVGENVYVQQGSNIQLDSLVINGTLHPSYYYEEWDGYEEHRASLQISNMDVVIASDPTNNDNYVRYGLASLVLTSANATLIDLNITSIELFSFAKANTIATFYANHYPGDGTGLIIELTTLDLGDRYYIGGTDVMTLDNAIYSQITVFGQAQLYATNVQVTNVVQVLDGASATFDQSSLQGIVSLKGYAALIATNPTTMGNVYVRENSALNVTGGSSFWVQAFDFSIVNLRDISYLYNLEARENVIVDLQNVTSSDSWYFYGPQVYIRDVHPTYDGEEGPSLYFYSNTSGIIENSEIRRLRLDYVDNALSIDNLLIHQDLWIQSSNIALSGLVIGDNIYLEESSSVDLTSIDLNGSIIPSYYYEDWEWYEERRSSLTLHNMNVSITSDPENNDYHRRSGLDTLFVDASNVNLFDLKINMLYARDHSFINSQNTEVLAVDFDETSGYTGLDVPITLSIDLQSGSVLPSGYAIPYTVGGLDITLYYSWDGQAYTTLPLGANITTPQTEGSHTLTLKAVDGIGKEKLVSINITVSNQGLGIILVGPDQNTILHGPLSIDIEFSGIPTVVYASWDGGANETYYPQSDEITIDTMPSSFGTHELELWVISDMDLTSYAVFSWELTENNIPQLAIIYPTEDDTVRDEVVISWDATDADGEEIIVSLYYQEEGSNSWTTIAQGIIATSYRWDISSLSSGTYTLRVVVDDGWDTVEKLVTFNILESQGSVTPEISLPGLTFDMLLLGLLTIATFSIRRKHRQS